MEIFLTLVPSCYSHLLCALHFWLLLGHNLPVLLMSIRGLVLAAPLSNIGYSRF